MSVVLSFPILLLLLMLQVGVVSQLPLLNGTADLLLLALAAWGLHDRVRTAWIWGVVAGLMVSYISAMPLLSPLIGYLAVVLLARIVARRMWQVPLLAMFLITFVGTIGMQILSILVLQIQGSPISWQESFSLVTLPSAFLNLLLAFPMYALINDLVNWVYPVEMEA